MFEIITTTTKKDMTLYNAIREKEEVKELIYMFQKKWDKKYK